MGIWYSNQVSKVEDISLQVRGLKFAK